MIQKLATSLSGVLNKALLDWHFKHAMTINKLIDQVWTEMVSLAASGGAYTFPPGSGLLIVNDNALDGKVGIYAMGGGTTTAIASASGLYVAGAPSAGEIGVEYSAGSYVLTNNTADARVLSLMLVKSRSA